MDSRRVASNSSSEAVAEAGSGYESHNGAASIEACDGAAAASTNAERPATHRFAQLVALGIVVVSLSSVVWAAPEHARGSTPADRAAQRGHHHETGATGVRSTVVGRSAVEDGVRYESHRRPDPTLPPVPAGPVKRFRVDVLMHETKVADGSPRCVSGPSGSTAASCAAPACRLRSSSTRATASRSRSSTAPTRR